LPDTQLAVAPVRACQAISGARARARSDLNGVSMMNGVT
jgi:hypothetical protein